MITLQNILEQTEGIYGARFSGAGFNGSSMALINPDSKEKIAEKVTREYLEKFPEYEGKFSIHFCTTADGVNLK